jgi:hypothetical protein
VRALAFTPRWIGGLLFCLTAASVCGFLGHWQWDVAQHGTLQNSAYAFNWWLFAALFVGFWFKALRDTARRDRALTVSPSPLPVPKNRAPAPTLPRPPLPSAQEDPDVAAWNQWLAELNANPQR